MNVNRQTVDLSEFPDLVVIYLGMRVNRLTGLKTLLGFGPKIARSVEDRPDGLLLHENLIFSLFPAHVGMRQYWRDFDSLEKWSRSDPHRQWWKQFMRDSGGTGLWHETYSIRGGFEAIYGEMPVPTGLLVFAPKMAPRGGRYGARERLGNDSPATVPTVVSEAELYGKDVARHGDQ